MKLDELKRIVNSYPDYMDNDDVKVSFDPKEHSALCRTNRGLDTVETLAVEIFPCPSSGVIIRI